MKHSTLVTALCKDGQEIKDSISGLDAHLLHMLVGLSGEVGELIDAIKKPIFYRKSIDLANVIEELGDIEFYLEGLRQGLDIERDKTIEVNIEKLEIRYGQKFSNQAAQERKDKQ